ncbi:MAG: hypothetical protein JOZ69_23185, partial [Myxococcales bacterium]|nr:hypothetical protein [Myxococcales bacterium]
LDRSSWDLPSSVFEAAEKREDRKFKAILALDGPENPYALHDELGQMMLVDCTIERVNATLDRVLANIEAIDERARRVSVTDTATGKPNQGAPFVRHLRNMIALARVIARGARNRDESRGAHYKPEFPQRDDAAWLRTTLAFHRGAQNGSPDSVRFAREFDYALPGETVHVTDAVDVSLVRPRARRYDTKQATTIKPSQPPPGPPRPAAERGGAST